MELSTATPGRLETLPLDALTRELETNRRPGLSWNAASDHRLDQLVERAAELNVDRSELSAALVFASSDNPDDLAGIILRWRRSRVRDVVIDAPADQSALEVCRPARGRRPKRASSK